MSLCTERKRILLIDDEAAVLDVTKRILEHIGYQVTAIQSSIDALGLFRDDPGRFDLVISDVCMPGMTGDRLAHSLMEINREIPVILCTGYSDQISEADARRSGIREFVMKPLRMKELSEIVRKVLDQGHSIESGEPPQHAAG